MYMNLYEFEGKELLRKVGIATPHSYLLQNGSTLPQVTYPVFVKAQILSGGRKEAGGVVRAHNNKELSEILKKLLENEIRGWPVESILIEESITHDDREYYLSFSCDPKTKMVLFMYSNNGGTGIEQRTTTQVLLDLTQPRFPDISVPQHILTKLFEVFTNNDCLLLEVNPLVFALDIKKWVALDAKIILDDCAFPRHPSFQYPKRPFAPHHITSSRETAARSIDRDDHRGTAGSTYVDLDGDIAMLPSGGGASLLAMDSLAEARGMAANYTEYSGNPAGDKVKKLVSIVVSKPGLNGLWVVGAIANFTDIAETLKGFIEGLRSARKELGLPIDYPIVIRRAGPNDKEAYKMLSAVNDFDLHVSGEETSIEQSSEIMVKLAHEYKNKKTHTR